ncbi:MAG: hypothetical protein JWN04_6642 [Myxococcaceae bacterium]|nr:hypothetical protein [Myxococcaceae bacterium]
MVLYRGLTVPKLLSSLVRACLLPAVLACMLFGYTPSAHAYVWMIRHGETQCSNCHADPSGGELLTKYGRAQGNRLLKMNYTRPDSDRAATQTGQSRPAVSAARNGFLWGAWDTPDWLLLGGSLRGAAFLQNSVSVFPMQIDGYAQVKFWRFRAGGSLGIAQLKQNSPDGRDTFITRNQGDKLNLLSRTHWIALDLGAKRDWTLRAGRLNLPFGLRVPEHYLWVRDVTRTDRESDQQEGVALAYNNRWLRSEVMAIAGNYQIRPDRYRERGYSAFAEYLINDGLGIGVSSLVTAAHADRVSFEQDRTVRGVHGVFMRQRIIKPLVVLAEADLMHISRRDVGYAGFGQLDYEPIQGLHLITTVEVLDQGLHHPAPVGISYDNVPGAGKPRAGGWVSADWFFYSQLELRVDGIFRQDSGAYVLAQLHAYL